MMKMKESYGLCPYLAEMERESLRNARIRNKEREKEETDIPEKLIAHIRRRKNLQKTGGFHWLQTLRRR